MPLGIFHLDFGPSQWALLFLSYHSNYEAQKEAEDLSRVTKLLNGEWGLEPGVSFSSNMGSGFNKTLSCHCDGSHHTCCLGID